MGGLRILGIVLVVLGVLSLVYGQFSYTKEMRREEARRG